MPPFREWSRRLWYLLNRRRFEDELLRDMEAHRERLDRPARFGNSLKLREDARDVWGWRWLDDLGRDLRLSVRSLRRSPVFAVTSALILSLGIGVNLALFHLVNAALIRPLNVKDVASLVRFDHRASTFSSSGVPYPLATLVEEHNSVLSAVLIRHSTEVAWGEPSEQRVAAAFVSPNWFEELGATSAAGRLLGRVDAAPDASPVVVISHALWQRQLGGRSDIAGHVIRVNERPAVVVGVAGRDFPDVGIGAPVLWMPISQVEYFVPGSRVGQDWNSRIGMFGRLRAGVTADVAKASLRTALAGLHAIDPAHTASDEWLEPAAGTARFLSAREAQQVWVIAAAAAVLALLVLMIACLNLSNLALARAMSRVREMSIRVGLGAGRWRVVRHLLAESVIVAVAGTAGGLALGLATVRVVADRAALLVQLDVSPDWRLGLAMCGTAVFAMLAVGLIPAWKIGRSDLTLAVRDGGERVSSGLQTTRFRYAMVAGQIAGSCLLLVVTIQLARSLQRAVAPDLGFEFANVAVLDPSLASHGTDAGGARRYWQDVRRFVEAHPETAATALVSTAPLSGVGSGSRYRRAPRLRITVMQVEPSFFAVMRIPLLAGRLFDSRDDPAATVIISKAVALDMYGTVDVIGQSFPKDQAGRIIVGVAGDAHVMTTHAIDVGEQYAPLGDDFAGASLLVRANTDPERLRSTMKDAAHAADARILPEIRMMRDDFERSLLPSRIASRLAGAVALLALALACLGIFGVVAHGARLRTREVGVRLALGAPRRAIVRMLLGHTMWAGGVGMALGLAGALALTRALGGAPFYVESRDPVTYIAAALTLALAGTAAALLPALRTLRTDPVGALRQE